MMCISASHEYFEHCLKQCDAKCDQPFKKCEKAGGSQKQCALECLPMIAACAKGCVWPYNCFKYMNWISWSNTYWWFWIFRKWSVFGKRQKEIFTKVDKWRPSGSSITANLKGPTRLETVAVTIHFALGKATDVFGWEAGGWHHSFCWIIAVNCNHLVHSSSLMRLHIWAWRNDHISPLWVKTPVWSVW